MALNGKTFVGDETGNVWKEIVMASSEVLSYHLSRRTCH